MTALSQSLTTSIDLYMWGSFLFYLGYGILCFFLFKTYCRYVYFRGNYPENCRSLWHGARAGQPRWTEFHDMDGPMDYMTRGAGECCLVMAYSVYFAIAWTYAIMHIVEGADPCDFVHLGDDFLTIQILTWCMWTLTEIFYTYKKVEWEVVGPIHAFLCIVVLPFSISAKTYYSDWVENGVCKI